MEDNTKPLPDATVKPAETLAEKPAEKPAELATAPASTEGVVYADKAEVEAQHKAVLARYLVRGMPVYFNDGRDGDKPLAAFIADVVDHDKAIVTLFVIDTSGFARPEANIPFGTAHRTWSIPKWY